MLTFAIIAENFTSAIGTVIFVAYLSGLCRNPLHTATQYALLTALSAFGRTYLSAGAGYVAAATGWVWFFAICAAVSIPSLVLLAWLQRRGHFASVREGISRSVAHHLRATSSLHLFHRVVGNGPCRAFCPPYSFTLPVIPQGIQ